MILVLILPPNPNTRRGYKTSWAVDTGKHQYLGYCSQNNVVLRNLKDPRGQPALVYTDFMEKVTAIQFSPNGEWIATGTEKGRVRIWNYQEESKEKFVVKKEHSMLAARVNTIAFTDDGKGLAAGGDGKDMFAKAVITESGTKQGDLFGPTNSISSIDIK